MKELADRISRTRTSIENWLAVDDALAREEFPDAQVLQDRMRVASARWPLGDELPARVADLARRVADYYESGEQIREAARPLTRRSAPPAAASRRSSGSSCGWSGCASRSASPTRSTRARCASSATAATAISACFPRRSRSTPIATIPAELFLQLADLAEKPQLLSDLARRRDSELLIARLLLGAPRYLERVLHQLEADARLDPKRLEQIYADLALLSEVMGRFASGRDTEDHPGLRIALFHLLR